MEEAHNRTKLLPTLILSVLFILLVLALSPRNSFSNASSVSATFGIGVYLDEACTKAAQSITWGVLSPGEIRREIVYVRNEGSLPLILVLTTINWNPETASQYIKFFWNCSCDQVRPGQVVEVTQTLYVLPSIKDITSFSFEILFEARSHFLGDINEDGRVSILDLSILGKAWESTPQDPNWNPRADLNKDSTIGLSDLALLAKDYGKTL